MNYLGKFKMNRKKFKLGLILTIVLLTFFNLTLGFNNLQSKTAIVGLRLGSQPLTFLDRPHIKQVVSQQIQKIPNNSLRFSHQARIFEIKKEELGAKIDPDVLTSKIIQEGRAGNFLQRAIVQTQALLGQKEVKLDGDISQSLLTLKIIEIQNEVNKEAVPIRPDFAGDLEKTLPSQDGIKVDTNKLILLISDNIFTPPTDPLLLPTIKTFASDHSEDELIPIRKQAAHLLAQPLSVSSGNLVFTLSIEELKQLLNIAEKPDLKDPKKLALVLRLDDISLNRKLGEFAQKVEKLTQAEFDDHDARATIYSLFFSGKRRLVEIPTGKRFESKVLGAKTNNGEKKVFLTFDDGPNSIYHPMILDILKSYNIRATFFLVGQNTQRDSEVAKRTMEEGHEIGNHSLTHAFLPKLKDADILNELQSTEKILSSLKPNSILFRPPYGGVNIEVKKHAQDLGLKLTLWDVDPRDWSEPQTNELVRRVVDNTTPGADVLLHSNHLATVKALPKIIESLKSQGYSFDTLH